jgi:predicted porin
MSVPQSYNKSSSKIGFASAISKTLFGALLAAGAIATANAADLGDSLKDGPPVVPDLIWHGIQFYGTYDVSAQYESAQTPYRGLTYTTNNMITNQAKKSGAWILAPNQETQSFWGLKTEQALPGGFTFIANAQSGFNSTTGGLSDAFASVQKNNGLVAGVSQNVGADGSRAGQLFNGDLYAGLSHPVFGTLLVGRQLTLNGGLIGNYDPLATGGYAFSLMAFSGVMAGQGASEVARVDQSAKYTLKVGPVHFSGFYGNPGTNVKEIYQGGGGFDYKGFSFDVFGGHASDIIAIASVAGAANIGTPNLSGTVSDTDMWGLMAKYKFDIGGYSGYKDAPAPDATLTFSGGYEHIDFSNPSDGGYTSPHEDIGGYIVGVTPGAINNTNYTGGDRILELSWAAAKLTYGPKWSFATGYYHYDQNSFGGFTCSNTSSAKCSGTEDVVSFKADYQWTKNLNLYAGFSYSTVDGGLASGFTATEAWTPTMGLRFQW